MKKILTLCMVCKDSRILLGMKKRGFGEGRWNGFGGKVEEGETVLEGARRELEEEVGIRAMNLVPAGILDFSFESDPKQLEVHIFRVDEYEGDPVETEEMCPEWFDFDAIPYEQMWSDDVYWLPHLLERRKFKGTFHFDRPSDATYAAKIISQHLEEISL